MDDKLKKIYIHAKRRGMKEIDLVLGQIADNCLSTMNDNDLILFQMLLEEKDGDILKWILSQSEIPSKYLPIWHFILSYKPTL